MNEAGNITTMEAAAPKGGPVRGGGKHVKAKGQKAPQRGRSPASRSLPNPALASPVQAVAAELAAWQHVAGSASAALCRLGQPEGGPFSEAVATALRGHDAAVARLASLPAADLRDLAAKAAWVPYSFLHDGGEAEEELARSVLRDLETLAPAALFWQRDLADA